MTTITKKKKSFSKNIYKPIYSNMKPIATKKHGKI